MHTEKKHSYQWEEYPICYYVIEGVEFSAEDENQPIMYDGYPNVEWAPGEATTDELGKENEPEHPIVNDLNNGNEKKEIQHNNLMQENEEDPQNNNLRDNNNLQNNEDRLSATLDDSIVNKE